MRTLAEMAAQGAAKLTAKAADMATSYNAAKPRMKAGYAETPFGPARKSAYNTGIDRAVYRAPDVATWQRNWAAKMAE